jgi:hypothetical protein
MFRSHFLPVKWCCFFFDIDFFWLR